MTSLKMIQFDRQELESIIHWKDVTKSSVAFCSGLLVLITIASYSIISLCAYTALITLLATVSFRVYKTVQSIVQKTNDGHPFKSYLEANIILSKEKIEPICGVCVDHLNALFVEIRRLVLVEDYVDTTKFAILLWISTYIGAWFNGYCLAAIAWIGLFTLPKFYENNRDVIDTNLELIKTKVTDSLSKFKGAPPKKDE